MDEVQRAFERIVSTSSSGSAGDVSAVRTVLAARKIDTRDAEAGTILAAWNDVARLVGREGTSPASVVDRVAVLAQATPATGGEPVRQTRAPEGVSPLASLGDLIERESAERAEAAFDYVGEGISERDYDGPISKSVYGCLVCGAVTALGGLELHRRWHRGERNE